MNGYQWLITNNGRVFTFCVTIYAGGPIKQILNSINIL